MARTHIVAAWRGQRKCQWKPEPTEENRWPRQCNQPLNAHLYRDTLSNLTGSTEWTIDDHPFTQTTLTCEYCRQPINIGDPYKWVAPRAHKAARGSKKVRHTTCPAWKPSELTSSPHLATIYAAQEDADAAFAQLQSPDTVEDTDGFLEALEEIAQTFAEAAREAVYSYQESAQNIEDGFGHPTYQSEELQAKSDDIDGWCSDIESWQGEEFTDELTCAECEGREEDEQHQDDTRDDYHEYDPNVEVIYDWADTQQSDLQDLIGECPV